MKIFKIMKPLRHEKKGARTCSKGNFGRRLIAIPVFFLVFSLSVSDSCAEIFYVDAVDGKDTNSGTLEGEAWQTLSKVNEVTFKPGDTIRFKRGGVWKENITLEVNYSGNRSEWIVFSDYGAGDLPKFDFSENNAEGILIFNSDFIRFQNLHIANAAETGIKVSSDLAERQSHEGGGGSGGCYIAAQIDEREESDFSNYLKGFQLSGCIVENNGFRKGKSNMGLDALHVDELKVSDTVFRGNQQSGVRIQSSSNVALERCEAKNHVGGNDHDGFLIQNTNGFEMYDCIAHHNSESGIDLGGYESFEEDMRDAIVSRCFVYENGDDGIAVSGAEIDDPTPFSTHNIYISYCLSYENGTYNLKIYQNARDVHVYNCLFDSSKSHNLKLDVGAHDIYFKNCIVSNSGGFPLDIWTDEVYPYPYNLHFDYMIWFPRPPESEYAGANFWVSNPEFINAEEHQYGLESNSPAIDTGTYIGEEFDRGLNPVSTLKEISTLDQDEHGQGWEIGPYIYPTK